MKTTQVFLIMLVVGFVSCTDYGTSLEESRRRILTSQLWKFQHYIIDGQQVSYDVTVMYGPNGLYYWFSGYGDPRSGTWELVNNAQSIVFDRGTRGVSSAVILDLSPTRFSMRGTTAGPADGNVPFEAVLVPAN